MKVDLQIHTVASSDSTLTVPALFEGAAAAGLAAVAITDHDTVIAIAEGTQAAAESGVSLVPGVEVSTSFRRYMAHALVYSDTIDNLPIREFLDVEVYQAKRQYTSTVIEALASTGVPISLQAYDQEAERSGKGGSPLQRALPSYRAIHHHRLATLHHHPRAVPLSVSDIFCFARASC